MKSEARTRNSKISTAFSARLDRLGPSEKVRAVVMLHCDQKPSGRRQSQKERQAAIETLRQSASEALIGVDDILKRFGGQRLANAPDALGSVPVETTAAGIKALASLENVKVILEDQRISLLAERKY